MEVKIIKVKFIGEDVGFCTKYYKDVKTKRFYALLDGVWYTTVENYGEPDCPIKKEIKFEVVEK